MALPLLGIQRKSQANKVSLLMERADNHNNDEHVIEIASSSDASSSGLSHDRPFGALEQQRSENQPSASSRVPVYQPPVFPANGSNTRNSLQMRRGNNRGRQRSPLNSGMWISVELLLTVSQILAAVIVLSLSKHEKTGAPLKTWIVGYASGCLAILPLLYWRFRYRNQGSEQVAFQLRQDSSQGNNMTGSLTGRVIGGEDRRSTGTASRGTQSNGLPSPRFHCCLCLADNLGILSSGGFSVMCTVVSLDSSLVMSSPIGEKFMKVYHSSVTLCLGLLNFLTGGALTSIPLLILLTAALKAFVEYFKMGLDCFFAVWFVVGNVWIFGGHSSSTEAPNVYRLCIVFLTFSCIGYAMPFILCATICCCLPCIFSVLGFREDLSQNRGATPESISSLPIYKFKVKKNKSKDSVSGAGEGGIVAAGTENERAISGEDAACCICLAKYLNNDELRELPCSHLFHKECLDKWLRINASCPLCKAEVGETITSSLMEATVNL